MSPSHKPVVISVTPTYLCMRTVLPNRGPRRQSILIEHLILSCIIEEMNIVRNQSCLGQHLSLCRKFGSLNHRPFRAPPPQKKGCSIAEGFFPTVLESYERVRVFTYKYMYLYMNNAYYLSVRRIIMQTI